MIGNVPDLPGAGAWAEPTGADTGDAARGCPKGTDGGAAPTPDTAGACAPVISGVAGAVACELAGTPLPPGIARKNSLAICSRRATSGNPAGAGPSGETEGRRGSAIVVELRDIDVFKNGGRIFGQNGQRAIERHEIGRDGLVVDAHEAD